MKYKQVQINSKNINYNHFDWSSLESHLKMETLLTDISANFINIPGNDYELVIQQSLTSIIQFIDADYISLLLLDKNYKQFKEIYECHPQNTPSEREHQKKINLNQMKDIINKLHNFEVIYIPESEKVSTHLHSLKLLFQNRIPQSILIIPVNYTLNLVGMIIIHGYTSHKSWSKVEINFLKLISEIFANAIHRLQQDEHLIESEEKWRSLVENNPDIIITINTDLKVNFINRNALGKKIKDIINHNILNLSPFNEELSFKETLESVFNSGKSITQEIYFYSKNKKKLWYQCYINPIRKKKSIHGASIVLKDVTDYKEMENILRESESMYREIASNLPGVVYQVITRNDKSIYFTYVGDSSFKLLGMKPEEIINNPKLPFHNISSDDYKEVKESIIDASEKLMTWSKDFKMITTHGKEIWVRGVSNPHMLIDGSILWNGVLLDITEQKLAEREITLAATVFQNTTEAIMITDSKGLIQWVNPAFTIITGYDSKEAIGKNASILNSHKHNENFFDNMWNTIRDKGKWSGEIWNRKKNGDIIPQWLNIDAVKDEHGNIIYYTAIFGDISERKKHEESIIYLAYHDALTDLPNRQLFLDRLELALIQAQRKNENVAILFLDLDGFKAINDRWGHHFGDTVLKEVAKILKSCVRRGDTVARYGGDEFTMVIPNIRRGKGIAKIAEKILDCIRKLSELDDKKISLSGSIGISFFPDDGTEAEVLLKKADAAMYSVKLEGKNNYR